MSEDTDLERWEITRALISLRGAYKRAMDAYGDLIRNQEIAGVSVRRVRVLGVRAGRAAAYD